MAVSFEKMFLEKGFSEGFFLRIRSRILWDIIPNGVQAGKVILRNGLVSEWETSGSLFSLYYNRKQLNNVCILGA